MFNFFKNIWRFYSRHFKRLLLPFQGILDNVEELEKVKTNYYCFDYFIPFILTIIICIDTGIQYWIHGYDRKKFVFFNHVIMKFLPEFFIYQRD